MLNNRMPLKVMIVDDDRAFRDTIRNILELESWAELVGMAGDVDEAVAMASLHTPDVIVIDYYLPSGTGAEAAAQIGKLAPDAALIMMSVETASDLMRRAMLSGARDFLVKPFAPSELFDALRRVSSGAVQAAEIAGPSAPVEGAQIITVHSPKGGCGVTSLVISLAVAKRLETGAKVGLLDLSLAYGDVGLMMDITAASNIYELSLKLSELDEKLLWDMMETHPSGVKVLLAPPQPQQAEAITGPQVRQILTEMSTTFDYIFVDTSHNPSDVTIVALDMARTILLVGTQEVAAVRNIKLFTEVAKLLEYPEEKMKFVLNKANNYTPLSPASIEQRLGLKLLGTVPEDLKTFAEAGSRGVPAVVYNRNTPATKAVRRIASLLQAQQPLLSDQEDESETTVRSKKSGRSLFARARA